MSRADTSADKAFVLTWTVQNFHCCLEKTGEFLKSSEFVVSFLPIVNWDLRLYPRGRTKENYVTCRLCESIEDDNQVSVCVSYDIAFIKSNGTPITTSNDNNVNLKIDNDFCVSETRIKLAKFSQDALTIRCRLWTSKTYPLHETLYLILTNIEIERNIFEWTVTYAQEGKCSIKCTKEGEPGGNQLSIKSDSLNCSSFQLEFEMNPITNKKADLFICRLYLLGTRRLQDLLHVLEVEGTDFETKWEFTVSLKWNELVCNKKLHYYNDVIKLKSELVSSYGVVTFSAFKKQESCLSSIYPFEKIADSKIANESLGSGLYELYREGSLCDVHLETPTKTFSAHSVVLSAISPVFKAMLISDMLEKATETVKVPDLEEDVVEALLQYAYISKVKQADTDFAMKVYYGADKYQMLSLRDEVSAYLVNHLTTSNVCDILLLAQMHRDDDLKRCVANFINLHRVEVFSSKEWKKVENEMPACAFEIFHKMYSS